MATDALLFRSFCEENLDKILND